MRCLRAAGGVTDAPRAAGSGRASARPLLDDSATRVSVSAAPPTTVGRRPRDSGGVTRTGDARTVSDSDFVGFDRASGRPVAVAPPDATETTIVGMRVADLPVPFVASEQRLCGPCGEAIWLATDDPPLRRLLDAGAGTVCLRCASTEGMTPDLVITSRSALERAWLAAVEPAAEA